SEVICLVFLGVFFLFILGAVTGSFLNVIIFRYQDETTSIINPKRSFCHNCGKTIRWYDNIPILSYLILKGKCRDCGIAISKRYPLVEILTGCVFAANYLVFNQLIAVLGASIIGASLIVVFFIDLDTLTISDWNSVFVLIGGIFLVWARGTWFRDIITTLIVLGVMTLMYILSKKGIGVGDVILICAASFALGPFSAVFSVFLASLLGIVYAVITKSSLKTKVPFGPFLAIGIYLALLFGDWVSSILGKLYQ
ncbi:MAG TPA: prepilin peptidase, partial [Thermotogota bacterium]|nr:prepilin peptidase [Thermotogota bacterium]